ncbi:MAG: hypothetical protein NTW86_10060, partial [Candidatus Sumerlaeota bacterium]|nr:hypothetical protein [Candidatus Sumerlaeota bacterium]
MALEIRFRGQIDQDCVWAMIAEVEGIAKRCGWEYVVLEGGGVADKDYLVDRPDAKVPRHNLVFYPPYRGIVVRADAESDWFPVLA